MSNSIFNIDSLLLIGFLIITIFLGWWSSRGITSFREFAVGNKTFSTATIVATTVATVLSGSGFFNDLSQTYDHGLYFLWPIVVGVTISFLSISYIYGPRMGEFLNKVSVAEAMGDMFGKEIRIITAVIGFLSMATLIATQLNVAGQVMEYGLGINPYLGAIIIGLIITIYSVHGGIKSVTFTDIIQFITFGTIVPTIVYFVAKSSENYQALLEIPKNNPVFDYKKVFDFTNTRSISALSLFIMMCIPPFTPQIFQRNVICKDTQQITKVNTISCIICISILILSCFISILVYSQNPNISGKEVLPYILNNYSIIGLRGLTLVGIMAMVMSTADSYVNSISVLCVNDFWRPLKIKKNIDDLSAVRIISFIIGILSIIISCTNNNLMGLLKLAFTFYGPVVTVPFLIAIMGFRPHKYCVLIAMFGGVSTTLIWEYIINIPSIYSMLPGMLANLILLFLTHYLFNLGGGWIDKNPQVVQLKQEKKVRINNLIRKVINFNISDCLKKNNLHNLNYSLYLGGIYLISAGIINIFGISNDVYALYKANINIIEISLFFIGTILFMIPLFNQKYSITTSLIWNFALFYLIFIGLYLIKITNCASIQVISWIFYISIVSLLTRWQYMILILLASALFTSTIQSSYTVNNEFLMVYIGILVSFVVIFFFKPQEEAFNLIKTKLDYTDNLIKFKDNELETALSIKAKFIAQVEDSYNNPLTNVFSLSQTLWHHWYEFTDKQKMDCVTTIYQHAGMLVHYEKNINTLHKLDKPSYDLDIKEINFSELLIERIEYCKKLQSAERKIDFEIEDNVKAMADKYYITIVMDNLINNAITYCKDGNIKIILKLDINENVVHFSILDDGIGIPQSDFTNIFGMFVTGSRTESKGSGNRGVGLSACEKIIKVHKGQIWPENNPEEGFKTAFHFVVPA